MESLDTIWALHQNPTIDLSHELAKTEIDFDQGQQIQLALLERWLAQGETLGGWKIGMTSGANRNAMGDGIRPFGFILGSRIFRSNTTLFLQDLHNGQVENELALQIGTELAPGATAQDAFQAVEAILPAFEINQKRLPAGAGSGLRVADDLSNFGIVIGDPIPPRRDLSNLIVTLSRDSGEVIESVASPDHIDDHYESLAILSNRLHDFGQKLMPGQYVITGAYGKTPFSTGSYIGEFDHDVGQVCVTLA